MPFSAGLRPQQSGGGGGGGGVNLNQPLTVLGLWIGPIGVLIDHGTTMEPAERRTTAPGSVAYRVGLLAYPPAVPSKSSQRAVFR